MGAGQFCTKPGVAVVLDGPLAIQFAQTTATVLNDKAPQTMLTHGIADAFQRGCDHVAAKAGVTAVVASENANRAAVPQLFSTTAANWMTQNALQKEVFGPMAILIVAKDMNEMRDLAHSLEGQLTCTLHLEAADIKDAQTLMPILERKAGRLLANGFPTGVEVCNSMVHSGPYPASTNFGATSVGSMAIRRFLRPVCFQNMPAELLPKTSTSQS